MIFLVGLRNFRGGGKKIIFLGGGGFEKFSGGVKKFSGEGLRIFFLGGGGGG